jgi:hypothetical protein
MRELEAQRRAWKSIHRQADTLDEAYKAYAKAHAEAELRVAAAKSALDTALSFAGSFDPDSTSLNARVEAAKEAIRALGRAKVKVCRAEGGN